MGMGIDNWVCMWHIAHMQPIPGLPEYACNEVGHVFSKALRGAQKEPKWRLLKQTDNGRGYMSVSVRWPDGKHRHAYVHRLVLMTFRGLPSPHAQARHLNGIRSDNHLSNLAWGTASENEADKKLHGTWASRMGGAKLSILDRLKARCMRKTGATTQRIATELGVSRSTISRLLSGKTWK
jgi:hypothetical protein